MAITMYHAQVVYDELLDLIDAGVVACLPRKTDGTQNISEFEVHKTYPAQVKKIKLKLGSD